MRIDEITRRGFLKGAGAAALTSLAGKSNAASKWVPFYSPFDSSNKLKFYFDRNSIVINGGPNGLITVWLKAEGNVRELVDLKEPYPVQIFVSKRVARERGTSWSSIKPDGIYDHLIDALKNEGII